MASKLDAVADAVTALQDSAKHVAARVDSLSSRMDALGAKADAEDRATIKKTSSNEANVSQRTVSYDLYVDGKYKTTYKDVNDAIDARDKINKEKK